MKLGAVGVITVLIAYLTICVLSPSKVAASKTIVIHYDVEKIQNEIADLSTWKNWHPYLDSAIESSIKVSNKKLAWTTFTGSEGEIELKELEMDRISFSTSFEKNGSWKTYQGEFLLEGTDRETKVSWVYVGEEFPFFKRPANYVIKEVIGKTMERGLFRFKKMINERRSTNE